MARLKVSRKTMTVRPRSFYLKEARAALGRDIDPTTEFENHLSKLAKYVPFEKIRSAILESLIQANGEKDEAKRKALIGRIYQVVEELEGEAHPSRILVPLYTPPTTPPNEPKMGRTTILSAEVVTP